MNFRNGDSAEGSGERTRPRVQFRRPAENGVRRDAEITHDGGGTRALPGPFGVPVLSKAIPLEQLGGGPGSFLTGIPKFMHPPRA